MQKVNKEGESHLHEKLGNQTSQHQARWPGIVHVDVLHSPVLSLAVSKVISRSLDSTKVIKATFACELTLSGMIALDAATVETKLNEFSMRMRSE